MKLLFFSLMLLTTACSKPAGPSAMSSAPADSASAGPSATASAMVIAPTGPIFYAGTYTSKEGAIHVPDGGEWSGVKWRGDEAGTGLGDGAMTLTIEPKTGRAEGTADGPIGPVVLAGMLQGGVVSFTLARKVNDDGLTGAAMGKLTGDRLDGTMNLSQATGNVIREASFSLSKK